MNVRWADRRGSYFFVIDAFIAGIIILAGVVVLFAQYTEEPIRSTSFYSAEDFFSVLESTELRNFDSRLLRNWSNNGTINNTRVSLLHQLALFNVTNEGERAILLANMTLSSLPDNVGGAIRMGTNAPDKLYWTVLSEQNETAGVFFSSKRIVLLRQTPQQAYPPVIVEVQTWQ